MHSASSRTRTRESSFIRIQSSAYNYLIPRFIFLLSLHSTHLYQRICIIMLQPTTPSPWKSFAPPLDQLNSYPTAFHGFKTRNTHQLKLGRFQ
ncbi:hypothetical protein BCR33DRAFT_728242 [Rhizoclosmatium globosum]|uniref:Uncharacterized protein n=1 Tax=Rhizoclosmatium globosum TaxID=329046 RepID=A0A1Y2AKQ6_9FUNG|nr:hypothetical protein BCR33DRAFT_728922 [Rhizoclosmatium globosum]ORY23072.1 hypothetical protein BCR33DRAFT_728242 [Rhizoclosmatium globosum]|eukprot:ORY22042.1 hypothetical protein BCR33DRAFT_728922 [Rhizoclosmatium globosum]